MTANLSNESFSIDQMVKDVFEHFRNLMVCAAIFIVGVSLVQPGWLGFDCSKANTCDLPKFVGWLDILLSVLLALLNSTRFFRIIVAVWLDARSEQKELAAKGFRFPHQGRIYGYLVAFSVLYLAVVASIILVGARLQLSRIIGA